MLFSSPGGGGGGRSPHRHQIIAAAHNVLPPAASPLRNLTPPPVLHLALLIPRPRLRVLRPKLQRLGDVAGRRLPLLRLPPLPRRRREHLLGGEAAHRRPRQLAPQQPPRKVEVLAVVQVQLHLHQVHPVGAALLGRHWAPQARPRGLLNGQRQGAWQRLRQLTDRPVRGDELLSSSVIKG